MERDETEERLERLLAATKDVSPRRDFSARVLGEIARTPIAAGFWADLPRVAKLAVPLAAVAAVATVVWAAVSTRAVDDASLATGDAPEQSLVSTIYGEGE